MKKFLPIVALGALIALSSPVLAQGAIPGSGGAKAQGFSSTVGFDQRPNAETRRASLPTFQAIEPQPYWRRQVSRGYRYGWRARSYYR